MVAARNLCGKSPMKDLEEHLGQVRPIAWITESFDEPDLLFAREYYRAHMDRIDPCYRPHPAMVPCGDVDKPTIFVKIPNAALEAFSQRVAITGFQSQSLALSEYAVLWMRLSVHDPGCEDIAAMVPGTVTIATKDADLSTVNLDFFLDVDSDQVLGWLAAWSTWPSALFLFVLDGRDRIAAHLNIGWPAPGVPELIQRCTREAQGFLADISPEKRDYQGAVEQLRRKYQSR